MEHYIEKPVAVESTKNVTAASLGTIHFYIFVTAFVIVMMHYKVINVFHMFRAG